MICFLTDCAAVLDIGMTVIEVGGQYCCPRHVREVTVGIDGRVPLRPEVIVLRRPAYQPPWEAIA